MRLAISSLAWPASRDAEVADLLVEEGAEGIELVPARVWPEPLLVSDALVRDYRLWWEDRGLPIVAVQSLLLGRPELTLFGADSVRERTLEHLAGMCRLGSLLGARVLVFAAPRSRLLAGRSADEAWELAVSFFRRLARRVGDLGVVVGIGACPRAYGCDFVTTIGEASRLVEEVGHPGVGLHLDGGSFSLGEEPTEVLRHGAARACHFHISEPHLHPIGLGETDHGAQAGLLREGGYRGWASIEMREPDPAVAAAVLRLALRWAGKLYAGAGGAPAVSAGLAAR